MALLEKLGYGFYLSYNTEPPPRPGPFQLTDWKASDAPLFPDRAVFPWHNFLSGSSAWDLPDWQRWLTQIGRMRYNTVMVHCYGNSPIFTFDFRGKTKPVGYFTSTAKGCEWGTQHVNDVRRLFGGESFHGPRLRRQDFDGPGRKAHRGRHRSDAASLQVGAQPRVPCLLRAGRGDPRIEPAGTDSPTAPRCPLGERRVPTGQSRHAGGLRVLPGRDFDA